MAHLEVEQHISTGILGRGTIFEITPQSVKPEVPVTKPNEREVPVIPSPIPERLPVPSSPVEPPAPRPVEAPVRVPAQPVPAGR